MIARLRPPALMIMAAMAIVVMTELIDISHYD